MALESTKSRSQVRRSREEWRSLMQRYEASGVTQSAFCREAGVALSTFLSWRHRLGQERARRNASDTDNGAFLSLDEAMDTAGRSGSVVKVTVELGEGVVLHIERA